MISTSFILILLIKIFFVLFVIGLVGGILVTIKNTLFPREYKYNNLNYGTTFSKQSCINCNREINPDWIVCPYCGKEK